MPLICLLLLALWPSAGEVAALRQLACGDHMAAYRATDKLDTEATLLLAQTPWPACKAEFERVRGLQRTYCYWLAQSLLRCAFLLGKGPFCLCFVCCCWHHLPLTVLKSMQHTWCRDACQPPCHLITCCVT
jgi:hypothetical protein